MQFAGRAANVNDQEAPYDLSTVTRWVSGGAAKSDADVPPAPLFGVALTPGRSGMLELTGVGFLDLTNTHTVAAGSLSIHYWNELGPVTSCHLAEAVGVEDTFIGLGTAGTGHVGTFLQIGAEVMRVEGVSEEGLRYEVTRAMHATFAAAHEPSTPFITCRNQSR